MLYKRHQLLELIGQPPSEFRVFEIFPGSRVTSSQSLGFNFVHLILNAPRSRIIQKVSLLFYEFEEKWWVLEII